MLLFHHCNSGMKQWITSTLSFLVMAIGLLLSVPGNALAGGIVERNDLNSIFVKHRLTGTFVLFSPFDDRLTVVNAERAAKRFIPASTFKIINSLIALQTGVVRDQNEIIPFGGKPQPFKSWEKDMSMKDAIRISNVPVYQEIARRVGLNRYIDWLQRLQYGNRLVGQDVETFWLHGPLKISAIEQVRFLARLAQKELPVKPGLQSMTMKIIKLQTKSGKSLYGKTGWTNTPDPDLGWFVGSVVAGERLHTFALNIDIRTRRDAKYRKPVALEFLKQLGIF